MAFVFSWLFGGKIMVHKSIIARILKKSVAPYGATVVLALRVTDLNC